MVEEELLPLSPYPCPFVRTRAMIRWSFKVKC